MTIPQSEKILEAACEICRWPGEVEDPDTVWEYCETCPVEAALHEVLFPPLEPGAVICAFCKKPVTTKPENGLRYCVHCHWWINEDGSHIEETREFLKGEKTP